jgi:hypothetical protein
MQLTCQSISEVKNATTITTQAIAKIEVQIGQIANCLGEIEKGKFLSQPVPNQKLEFAGASSSNSTHGPEHVQAIVTLRSGRQVDNQVVLLEENLVVPQGQDSGSNEERDVEPSKATPTIEDPLKSFVPKAPYQTDYKRFIREGSLRTFWRCSNKSKLISHFWMPSSKCHRMPSS